VSWRVVKVEVAMRWMLGVLASLAILLSPAAVVQAAPSCNFILGFATLASLIPTTVGQCLDNQTFDAVSGDALQHTTNGLLVWRKADNWTAFTNGYLTWVNGPYGVQQRLNTQRFAWEANPTNLPIVGQPAPVAAIQVLQPRPYDLVDTPLLVAGVGTGFEGTFSARVRDGNGNQLALQTIHAGGTGIFGNFQLAIALPATPSTAAGTLEVFEFSAKGDGSEINKVTVPITFGAAIVNPYHGFTFYTVGSGDTLASIATHFYGNATKAPLLQVANRDLLAGAPQPQAGQVLRIPQ
jgi:hypothetical protein